MVKLDSVQESLRLIQSEIKLLNFVHRHQTLNAAHDSNPHAKQYEAVYAQAIPPPPPTHVARAQAALLARRTGARPAQAFTPSAQDEVTCQWSSGSSSGSSIGMAAAPHTTTTKATIPSLRRTVQLRLDGLV